LLVANGGLITNAGNLVVGGWNTGVAVGNYLVITNGGQV
jgi:hypothetical protein